MHSTRPGKKELQDWPPRAHYLRYQDRDTEEKRNKAMYASLCEQSNSIGGHLRWEKGGGREGRPPTTLSSKEAVRRLAYFPHWQGGGGVERGKHKISTKLLRNGGNRPPLEVFPCPFRRQKGGGEGRLKTVPVPLVIAWRKRRKLNGALIYPYLLGGERGGERLRSVPHRTCTE